MSVCNNQSCPYSWRDFLAFFFFQRGHLGRYFKGQMELISLSEKKPTTSPAAKVSALHGEQSQRPDEAAAATYGSKLKSKALGGQAKAASQPARSRLLEMGFIFCPLTFCDLNFDCLQESRRRLEKR